MTPQQSAKTITETLKAKGVETDIYASMNALAEDLIDAGMELEEIEEGLTVGFNNGWFEMFDDFIAVTRTGESLLVEFVNPCAALTGEKSTEGISVVKPLSPSAAAKCVLQAFAFHQVGASAAESEIDEYFRRRMLPPSDMDVGLRYATRVSWIRPGAFHTYVLLEEGAKALAQLEQTPSNPVSAWHAWLHR